MRRAAFGGMAELVRPGVDGLHFSPADAADLARQLQRLLDEPPSLLTINSQGRIERYDEKGAAKSKTSFSGAQTLTMLGANGGFRVDGTLVLQDELGSGSANVTSVGLTRTEGCCYPTSGSLEVAHSDGRTQRWSFGPACGDVSVDGHAVTLAQCF